MLNKNSGESKSNISHTAQDFYNNFAMHKSIVIEEGEHSVDGNFNRIEFTYTEGDVTATGEIGHIHDQLFFSFAYIIDSVVMDIEYINLANEKESYIEFSANDAVGTRVIFAKGDVTGFEVNYKNKSWLFKKLQGQVFPELVEVKG